MKDKQLSDAFSENKGALHRMMGVPTGKKIPWDRMVAAAKQHRNELLRKRAQAAMNMMKARQK